MTQRKSCQCWVYASLDPTYASRAKRAPQGAAPAANNGLAQQLDAGLDLACGLAVADGDAARLQALRDIAHEVDMQQTVLELGALHLDVVGELEAALEGSGGDAAVQELALLVLGLLLGADGEHLLLDVDVELVLAEAGHRHADPVLVVGEPLDVVGRVGGRAAVDAGYGVEQVEEPVEADGGAIEGGKIDVSHHKSSFRSDVVLSACPGGSGTHLPRKARQRLLAHPIIGMRKPRFRCPWRSFKGVMAS